MTNVLLLLLLGHFLADYPLQGDFLARAKSRYLPVAGVPWYQALLAHASIHAGSVFLVTGSLLLASAELISHCVIDDLKCFGRISFNTDQIAHVICKVMWAVSWAWMHP